MRHAIAASLLLLAAAPAAAEGIADVLPPNTHLAFWVDNIAEARADAEKNPFVRLLMDEKWGVGTGAAAVGRALGRVPISPADPLSFVWEGILPVLDDGIRASADSASQAFAIEAKDFTDTFTGSLAVFSTLYRLTVENGTDIVEWDTIFAATYKPEERERVDNFLAKALARVPASAKKKTVEYAGLEVNHIEYFIDEESGDKSAGDIALLVQIPIIIEYAHADGMLFLAEGRGDPLRGVLEAWKGGARLAGGRGYQEAAKNLGEPKRFHAYYDVARHVAEWKNWKSKIPARRAMSALGLADAGPILATATIAPEGVDVRASLVTLADPQGIFPVLSGSPDNKAEALALVPEDAMTFGTLSVDLLSAWRQWRAAMIIMNPQSQLALESVLSGIQGAAGINIEEDLIAKSAGEVVCYVRTGADGRPGFDSINSAFILPVRGGTAVADALNGFMQRITGEQTRLIDAEASEVNGNTVWECRLGRNSALHVSATARGIVIGNTGEEARAALRRIAGAESAGSVRERADVRDRIAKLPQDGLRGFVLMPGKSILADLETRRQALAELGRADAMAPKDELEKSIGDIWWTLQAGERSMLLRVAVEGPK